jgi:hypothetical protein
MFIWQLGARVALMSEVAGTNNSYKPITNTEWAQAGFVNYKKWCTRLAAACDKVYQLLAHGGVPLRLPQLLKLVAMKYF